MIINELDIRAFGKFRQTRVDLSDGINVIEGENESGKTTIHAFIEAVLYGFIKPGLKRRVLLDDHDRYRPKDTDDYGGSLVVTHEGKPYRIRRDLRKGAKNPITITHNTTGEDITERLFKDDHTKLPDLGAFFDVPYTLYTNTLSVRQLEGKTDEAVADEVIRRAGNLLASGSEAFSPTQAIGELTKARDAIGTEKAPTRPLAKTIDAVQRLEAERDAIYRAHDDTLEMKATLENLRLELQKRERIHADLDHALAAKTQARINAKHAKVKALNDTINERNNALNALAPYAEFDADAVDRYLQATTTMTNALEQREALEKELNELRRKQRDLAQTLSERQNPTRIIADRQAYREAAAKHDEAACAHATHMRNRLAKKRHATAECIKCLEHTKRWLKRRWYTGLTLIAWLVLTPLVAVCRHRETRLATRLNTWRDQADAACEPADTMRRIQAHHGIDSAAALEAIYETALSTLANHERLSDLKTAIDAKTTAITTQDDRADTARKTLQALHHQHHVDSLEGLKTIRDKHRQYHAIKKDIDALRVRLDDLLDGETVDALTARVDSTAEAIAFDDLDEVQQSRDELTSEINERRVAIDKLKHQIESTEATHRPLETVEHELDAQRTRRDELMAKRQRHQRAIDIIERAVAAIEENFAPVLSEKIGEYVHTFTRGRYRDIKVKKTMAFTAYDKRSGDFESPEHFSRGTLDQIYFALRVGLLDTLGKQHLPLLLDDAFVAYDEARLTAALKTLHIMRHTRQVLVFTCHDRERVLAKQLAIPAHTITLTEKA